MLDLIRHRTQSWGVKIIFGIIILVFVFWGVGQVNTVTPNVAATVNGETIPMADFYGALKQREEQIRSMYPEVTQDDLIAFGIPMEVLNSLVARAAVHQDAKRLGIGITDAALQQMILNNPVFMRDGKFSRELYEQIMGSQGRSVVQAERDLAGDLLQEKLRGYVSAAAGATPDTARRAYAFQAERRSASYVLFATDDYLDQASPTEDDILAFYNSNAQRFSHPDRTSLSYISVTPAVMADADAVPDADVDAAFAGGPSRFHLSQVGYALPESAAETDREAAREALRALAAEIREGKDLTAAVAEAMTADPAIQGGDAGWVGRTQLLPEWEAAFSSLKKGDLTEILDSPVGPVFFRLEETDPDQDLPEALIKADLRRQLAEEQALLSFHEVQDRVMEAIDLGKSLDDIAADLGLGVAVLPLQPRDGIPAVLGLREAAPEIFGAPEKSLIPNVLETQDGFVVARIDAQQAAGPMPLDDVRSGIVEEVRRGMAARLAEQAANDALAGFSGDTVPANFADRVLVSAAFMRGGTAADFGVAPALGVAVFDNAPGAWIPRVFAVDKGVVIARTNEILAVSDTEWEAQQANVIQALTQARQSALFALYLEALDNVTTIEVNPQTLREFQQGS